MKLRRSNLPKRNPDFVRCTVSLPAELGAFAEVRQNEPQHAGSLSSYVRWLIIADRQSAGNGKRAK